MTALKLTPKQTLFLEFLARFEKEKGYAPSQQEIAHHFGFKSLGTVQDYLKRLEEQGALEKILNARRSTSVTAKATAKLKSTTRLVASSDSTVPLRSSNGLSIEIPIEGKVAAGRPIEAIHQHSSIQIPATLIPNRFQKNCFALQVSGDSMIDDGIYENDFVILKKQSHAENGQTVVALLERSEATIKRFYKKPGRIELHSANSKYQPIIIDSEKSQSDRFQIAGVLIALFRKF